MARTAGRMITPRILLAAYALPLLVAAAYAVQTPFACVDDYSEFKSGRIWRTLPAFGAALAEYAAPTDEVRYRPTWRIFDQGLPWAVFGNRPWAHHLYKLSLRLAAAALAWSIVRRLQRSDSPWIPLVPVGMVMFSPIVPEARLGPQEPLAAVLMLSAFAIVVPKRDAAGECPEMATGAAGGWQAIRQAVLVLICVLLAGAKETALPVLWVFAAGLAVNAFRGSGRPFVCISPWTTLAIAAAAATATWHAAAIAAGSSYVQQIRQLPGQRESAWRLWQLVTGWEVQPFWVPAIWIAGLLLAASGAVCGLWKPHRRTDGLWPAWFLLAALAYLVPHLRVAVAARYVLPALWLLAIAAALGADAWCVHEETEPRRESAAQRALTRAAAAWTGLVLTLLPLSQASSFLTAFAVQARVRQNEERLREAILAAEAQGDHVYLAGVAGPPSGPGATNELACLLLVSLKEFRTEFGLGPPIAWAPVERLHEDFAREPDRRAVVFSQWSWERLFPRGTHRAGADDLEAVHVAEFRPEKTTRLAWVQRGIIRAARQLGLHNRKMNRLTDAGAPPLDDPAEAELYVWYVYEVRARPR